MAALDEAATAEAAQAIAVAVELLGALAALGEDEHELALSSVRRPWTLAGWAGTPPSLGSSIERPG